jgi:hypothetical protein
MQTVALLAALGAFATGPAFAEGQMIAVPAGDHLLAFTLPDGFDPVAEDPVFARLAGEAAEAWTQTISVFVNTARVDKDPSMDISMLGGIWQPQCPDTYEETDFGSIEVPGSDAGAYAGWKSCGSVEGATPSRAEEVLAVAVSGPSGAYMITWTIRSAPLDDGMDRDDDLLEARLATLTAGIKVCPKVAGEAAPYPSCIGG